MESHFLLLKPDATKHQDEVLYRLEQAGFKILSKKNVELSYEQASEFYADYAEDPDFEELLTYMTRYEESQTSKQWTEFVHANYPSGPVVAISIQHYDVFKQLEELVGPSDPVQARQSAPESLRAKYGQDELHNSFHVSEPSNIEKEARFFFPDAPMKTLPTADEAKLILENHIYPVLLQGLTQLCKEKPANPTTWLGHWLLENNPSKPKVQEPEAVS
ncbi:nucleoside diphosphate kinase [Gaertneriomyces semiglobifer]|nr:nucleoside diphosphate kinase [Gaertneriomyces semiglobifer]